MKILSLANQIRLQISTSMFFLIFVISACEPQRFDQIKNSRQNTVADQTQKALTKIKTELSAELNSEFSAAELTQVPQEIVVLENHKLKLSLGADQWCEGNKNWVMF